MSITCYRCNAELTPTGCSCPDGQCIVWGDCREVLPRIQPVDLVLTDPPYSVGWSRRATWGSSNKGQVKNYGKQEWDAETPAPWVFGLILDRCKSAVIWGGNYFPLEPSQCWLVWDKDNTGDFADCELAWTNFEKAVRKIKWRWNGMLQENGGDRKEPRFHPTQKPLAVMKWSIEQAPDGTETILDPYVGSGTTLVAAKQLNKRCIGIEREERYVQVACERLRQGVLDFGAA